MKRLTHHSRAGFTLVELLVAAALTVLIMAIMATAFQTGMSTLSHLKSVVGLSEQLRSAETIIRNDLEATHLEAEDGSPVRVSDPRLANVVWNSPGKGYFQVLQGSPMKQNYNNSLPNYDSAMTNNYTHVQEGVEDGILAVRATDHAVFFTAKRKANSKEEVFYGEAPNAILGQSLVDFASPGAPANQFISEWAEIGLFLVPNKLLSVNDDPTAPPLPLYTLVRRQRVLAKNATNLTPINATNTPKNWRDAFPEASISTQPIFSAPSTYTPNAFVNDPATIADPRNRLPIDWNYAPAIPTPFTVNPLNTLTPQDKVGTDILLTNVISMQVRMMFNDYNSSSTNLNFTGANFFDELPVVCSTTNPNNGTGFFPRVHDTGSAFSTVPNGMNPPIAVPKPVARAIQIRLRIYDTKNHMTRQMTITSDL